MKRLVRSLAAIYKVYSVQQVAIYLFVWSHLQYKSNLLQLFYTVIVNGDKKFFFENILKELIHKAVSKCKKQVVFFVFFQNVSLSPTITSSAQAVSKHIRVLSEIMLIYNQFL